MKIIGVNRNKLRCCWK